MFVVIRGNVKVQVPENNIQKVINRLTVNDFFGEMGLLTGEPRTATLLYATDGDRFVVVASRYGGPVNPGWYHNLLARPDAEIQVGRRRIPVRAHVAEAEERTKLWELADRVNKGGYTTYQARTERQIPVVVLEPR